MKLGYSYLVINIEHCVNATFNIYLVSLYFTSYIKKSCIISSSV